MEKNADSMKSEWQKKQRSTVYDKTYRDYIKTVTRTRICLYRCLICNNKYEKISIFQSTSSCSWWLVTTFANGHTTEAEERCCFRTRLIIGYIFGHHAVFAEMPNYINQSLSSFNSLWRKIVILQMADAQDKTNIVNDNIV